MDSKSFVKVMRKLISEEVRKAVRAEMRILLKEQAVDHKKSMKHGMDMYQEPRTPKPVPGKKDVSFTKDSILNDVDFEVELVHRDDVNVYYILTMLSQMVKIDNDVFAKKRKVITDILAGELNLRSKRELIEKFIDENLVHVENPEDIEEAFDAYWNEEKSRAFNSLIEEENLDKAKIQSVIEEYLYSNQVPDMDGRVNDALLNAEPLFQRMQTKDRVIEKLMKFIDTFIERMVA